jgi:hypothetical protein
MCDVYIIDLSKIWLSSHAIKFITIKLFKVEVFEFNK